MTLSLYLQCFAVALVGWALQTALKMKALQDKAKMANVEFNPRKYFAEDWISIVASMLTIVLFLLFVDNVLNWNNKLIDYVKIGFGFVGYTGSDIASRVFSVVNKRINTAIGDQTNTTK